MAFRDDRDALLARADALDRENRALRDKLDQAEGNDEELEARNKALTGELAQLRKRIAKLEDEPKRKPKPESKRRRAPTATGSDGSSWLGSLLSGPRKWWAVPVAVVGAAVLGASAYYSFLVQESGTAKPNIERAWVTPNARGSATVSVIYRHTTWSRRGNGTRRTKTSRRLTAFDLGRPDAEPSTVVLQQPREARQSASMLFRRHGNRVWTHHPKRGVTLLDLHSASVVLDAEALRTKIPSLGEFKVRRPSITDYSPPTAAIPIVRPDGRKAWIDMTPAVLDAAPTVARAAPRYFCDVGRKPSCERTHCFGFTGLPGTTALQLASAGQYPNRDGTPVVPAGPNGAALLRPGFVKRLDSPCALELDGKVLVVRDSTTTANRNTLLSLLDSGGQILWTQPVTDLTRRPGATIMGAAVVGDDIYVLLSTKKLSLDAVRLSPDGRVLSKHPLL